MLLLFYTRVFFGKSSEVLFDNHQNWVYMYLQLNLKVIIFETWGWQGSEYNVALVSH